MPDFTSEEIEEVVKASRKFHEANLRDIDLSRADLNRANLRGANLCKADLSMADLRWATYDNKTEFPAGFDPEREGMVLVE